MSTDTQNICSHVCATAANPGPLFRLMQCILLRLAALAFKQTKELNPVRAWTGQCLTLRDMFRVSSPETVKPPFHLRPSESETVCPHPDSALYKLNIYSRHLACSCVAYVLHARTSSQKQEKWLHEKLKKAVEECRGLLDHIKGRNTAPDAECFAALCICVCACV